MSFIKVTDPRKREALIKDFIETRKRIKDNFVARKVGESEYQRGLTKLFKPVTETQKATAKEITEAQKATAKEITEGLLPIKEGLENITVIPPLEMGEETLPSIEMTEEEIEKIGPIATKYIRKILGRGANIDKSKAGLYSDGESLKIGSEPIKVENDDIIINEYRFKGTPGLWKLITEKNIPDKYNAPDLRDYIYIMSITNATRAKHAKDGKRIGGNNKMEKLIKPLVIALEEDGEDALIKKISEHFGYKEETDEDDLQPSTSGTGLTILPSDPNALIDRFDLLFTSQKAGHTGVRNEIISILDELKRQGVINTNTYKKLNSVIRK